MMIETTEYFKMLNRMLFAGARRAAIGDDIELRLLFDTLKTVEKHLGAAARAQVSQGGKSWSDVGRALGMSKQAAFKRWSKC